MIGSISNFVIELVNIASDLSIVSPDLSLYRQEGLDNVKQQVKPALYSVVKTEIISHARYFATYWADYGVRVNSFSTISMYNNQSEDFIIRLVNLIPLNRIAYSNELKEAVLYLCLDTFSCIIGINLVIDGGRSVGDLLFPLFLDNKYFTKMDYVDYAKF